MKTRVYILTDLFDDEVIGVYSSDVRAKMAAVDLVKDVCPPAKLAGIADEAGFNSVDDMFLHFVSATDFYLEEQFEISIDSYILDA